MCIFIAGIGSKLGSDFKSSDEICRQIGLDEKTYRSLIRKCGNRGIYRVADEESLESITCEASVAAVHNAGLSLDDLSGIFSVITPTTAYLIPGLGRMVADGLGLRNVNVVPVGAGCVGGMDALLQAYNQLVRDATEGREASYLVLCGERTSRNIDPMDKNTAFLFSEGASAFLVTNRQTENGYRLDRINCVSAEGNPLAMRLSNPFMRVNGSRIEFQMDGEGVYSFVIRSALPLIPRLVGLSSIADAPYFLPHQPSMVILKQIMFQLGLDESRMYIDGIRKFGNLSGASFMVGLEDAIHCGYVDGKEILLASFGAELKVGAAYIAPVGDPRKIVDLCWAAGRAIVRPAREPMAREEAVL